MPGLYFAMLGTPEWRSGVVMKVSILFDKLGVIGHNHVIWRISRFACLADDLNGLDNQVECSC